MSNKLRVLISKSEYGGGWIAQCLDYRISAQGPTIKETKKRFGLTIIGQIMLDNKGGKEPLKWLGQPDSTEDRQAIIRFENGEKIESKPIPTGIESPNFPKEIIPDTRIYEYA